MTEIIGHAYKKTWMEYVREGHKPEGNPPGFRPCIHCGLPLVFTKITDPLDPRWEWCTPLGTHHDCDELLKRLEDYNAECAEKVLIQ